MDEEVCRPRGEYLNISEVEGKWEGIEEEDKPILVMGVPQLEFDLLALVKLTDVKKTEVVDTNRHLSNGILQCFRVCVGVIVGFPSRI